MSDTGPIGSTIAAPRAERASRFRPFGEGKASARKRPLPPPISGTIREGSDVTVLDAHGARVDHAIVVDSKLTLERGQPSVTVLFKTGEQEGMRRHVQIERLRAGWLAPRDGFVPWKGFTREEQQAHDVLEKRRGVPLVPARDVRAVAPGKLSKAAFDVAALKLAKSGVVMLYQHDHPSGQSAEERDAMVRDGDRYFNAIGIRRGT